MHPTSSPAAPPAFAGLHLRAEDGEDEEAATALQSVDGNPAGGFFPARSTTSSAATTPCRDTSTTPRGTDLPTNVIQGKRVSQLPDISLPCMNASSLGGAPTLGSSTGAADSSAPHWKRDSTELATSIGGSLGPSSLSAAAGVRRRPFGAAAGAAFATGVLGRPRLLQRQHGASGEEGRAGGSVGSMGVTAAIGPMGVVYAAGLPTLPSSVFEGFGDPMSRSLPSWQVSGKTGEAGDSDRGASIGSTHSSHGPSATRRSSSGSGGCPNVGLAPGPGSGSGSGGSADRRSHNLGGVASSGSGSESTDSRAEGGGAFSCTSGTLGGEGTPWVSSRRLSSHNSSNSSSTGSTGSVSGSTSSESFGGKGTSSTGSKPAEDSTGLRPQGLSVAIPRSRTPMTVDLVFTQAPFGFCLEGFVVTEIMEGSQAHHQGLQPGDVLCSAQQISLKDLPEQDVPAFLISLGSALQQSQHWVQLQFRRDIQASFRQETCSVHVSSSRLLLPQATTPTLGKLPYILQELDVHYAKGPFGFRLAPIQATPPEDAYVAGFQSSAPTIGFLFPGDRIVAVDGVDVRGKPYSDIVSCLQARPAVGKTEFGRLTVQRTFPLRAEP